MLYHALDTYIHIYIYIPSMEPKEITAVGVDFGGQGEFFPLLRLLVCRPI